MPPATPTRAMVLAAGLGTRLKPLTDSRPKALVELTGRTLLEITLNRLKSYGITEIIINTHHFAAQITDYLKSNNNFGLQLTISHEEVLLDTGGGLKKASWFFLNDPARLDEPFVLHNVDILTDIDLAAMFIYHQKNQALATLAVRSRDTSRPLLFTDTLELSGHRNGRNAVPTIVRPEMNLEPLAFSGVHLIFPRLLPQITEDGIFSIIPTYLRIAATQKIQAFRVDQYYWRDLGRLSDLDQAARDIQNQLIR